jgi:bromodomain and PHD finger-containing protein 1
MKIEPVREMSINGTTVSVKKTAFCDVHTPPDMDYHPMIDNGVSSDEENKHAMTPGQAKAKSRIKMRKARKILAEKRNAVPIVSIPTISPQK